MFLSLLVVNMRLVLQFQKSKCTKSKSTKSKCTKSKYTQRRGVFRGEGTCPRHKDCRGEKSREEYNGYNNFVIY